MRFILAALLAVAIQEAPQDRPGSIEGTVVTAGAVPAPIAGAHVVVTPGPDFPASTRVTLKGTTDGAGRFSFSEVPPGRYTITARHERYGVSNSGTMSPARKYGLFQCRPQEPSAVRLWIGRARAWRRPSWRFFA
jgi:hypothetical protein